MSRYSCRAKIWKYDGPAGWVFVSLPKTLSNQIRKKHGISEEGWGRLKAVAQIGKSKWKTAIWFSEGRYHLPLKASVRKSEGLSENDMVKILIQLEKPDPKLARFLA